ncbi:MAG: DUF2461 domain-containing protein [Bdellovibrionales bacterium]|nr:DUF2461 domain-containing protein [Bdellovibrionales bacterium]
MPVQKFFNKDSIAFLNKATRQKKLDWLDKNKAEYKEVLVEPMKELMQTVAKELRGEAPGYRFPKMGFARIKRSWDNAQEKGPFRNWFHVSVSRDSESRYDSLPNLYFHFSDKDYYTAGGLYVPSADQTKHIRKWIDKDPSQLETLLKDREFKKHYIGLGTERVLKTKPRDYPIDHPRFDWLRMQAWYVWRYVPAKQALSRNLADVIIADWRQVLRLNRILDQWTTTWPKEIQKTSLRESVVLRDPSATSFDF